MSKSLGVMYAADNCVEQMQMDHKGQYGWSQKSNSLFHQVCALQPADMEDQHLTLTQDAGNYTNAARSQPCNFSQSQMMLPMQLQQDLDSKASRFHQELHQRAKALSNTRMSKGSRNGDSVLERSVHSHDRDGDFLDDRQMVSFGRGESKDPLAAPIPSPYGVRAQASPGGQQTPKIPGRDNVLDSYNEDPGPHHFKLQRLELFAEKAGLRFTMKELATILDDLNSKLCQQAVQHEILAGQDTAAQSKSISQIQESNKSALSKKRLQPQLSNLKLLEYIQQESKVMRVRLDEVQDQENNVWKEYIKLKQANRQLQDELDQMECRVRGASSSEKATKSRMDMRHAAVELGQFKMRGTNQTTKQTSAVALVAEEFPFSLDTTGHQSSTASNGQQMNSAMVSFRQDQDAREFQASLSARELAANVSKSIRPALAKGKDAAPALKQRMDEKDQLIKVLNEYIEKLKSELITSRSQSACMSTLDMPVSTGQHHPATAALGSQKSTESMEPNARRSQEQTARSAIGGSFRATPTPEYAENDYVHTSMDDRESCAVSDGGRAYIEANKHDIYHHQIYQLTQQVQRLASQLGGPDPMNTSHFKNGHLLLMDDGHAPEDPSAGDMTPCDSSGGNSGFVQATSWQNDGKGAHINRAANAHRMIAHPDGSMEPVLVEDARYMEQISEEQFGQSFLGQLNLQPLTLDQCQYPKRGSLTHIHSQNLSALSSFREGKLISQPNSCRKGSSVYEVNQNPNSGNFEGLQHSTLEVQKRPGTLGLQVEPISSQGRPGGIDYQAAYLDLQRRLLELQAELRRASSANGEMQYAIDYCHGELEAQAYKMQEIEELNASLMAASEQKDDDISKLRILKEEMKYLNDADKIITEGLKGDLQQSAQQVASLSEQVSQLAEQNSKLEVEKQEMVDLTEEGKHELEKMMNDSEALKEQMAKEAHELKNEIERVRKDGLDNIVTVKKEHAMQDEARDKVYRQRVEEKERILEQLNQQLLHVEKEHLSEKRQLQQQRDQSQQEQHRLTGVHEQRDDEQLKQITKLQRENSIRTSESLRLQDEALTLKLEMEELQRQCKHDLEVREEHHAKQLSSLQANRQGQEFKRSLSSIDVQSSNAHQSGKGDTLESTSGRNSQAKQLFLAQELEKVMSELNKVRQFITETTNSVTLDKAMANFDEFKLKVLENIILWHERTNDIARQASHYEHVLQEYLGQIHELKQLVVAKNRHIAQQTHLIRSMRKSQGQSTAQDQPATLPTSLLQAFRRLQTSVDSQIRMKDGECKELLEYQDQFQQEYVRVMKERDQLHQDRATVQEKAVTLENQQEKILQDQRQFLEQVYQVLGLEGAGGGENIDLIQHMRDLRNTSTSQSAALSEGDAKLQEMLQEMASQRALFLSQIQTLEEALERKQKEWIDTQDALQNEFSQKEAEYEKQILAEQEIATKLADDVEFHQRKSTKLEQKMFAELERVCALKNESEVRDEQSQQQQDKLKMMEDAFTAIEDKLLQTEKVLDDRVRQLDDQDERMKEQNMQIQALLSAKDIITNDNEALTKDIQNKDGIIENYKRKAQLLTAHAAKEVQAQANKQLVTASMYEDQILEQQYQLAAVKKEADQQVSGLKEGREAERRAMQDQLNQRMEMEKELFQEIKRYQDSVAYLSRQLDERTATLEEQSLKCTCLKRLNDGHAQKPSQNAQVQTDAKAEEEEAKLALIEKQLFDSMSSKREYKKEIKHLRDSISRQDSEIKHLIQDKRELEREIALRPSSKASLHPTNENAGDLANHQSLKNLGNTSFEILHEKDKYIGQLEDEILLLRGDLEQLKEQQIELEMESLLETKRHRRKADQQQQSQSTKGSQQQLLKSRRQHAATPDPYQMNQITQKPHRKLLHASISTATYGIGGTRDSRTNE